MKKLLELLFRKRESDAFIIGDSSEGEPSWITIAEIDLEQEMHKDE
jgi:hypothetical protein